MTFSLEKQMNLFKEYCDKNIIPDGQLRQPQQLSHVKLVNRIYEQPHLIGVRFVENRYKEVPFYSEDRMQIGSPDVIFFSSRGDLYFVEAKSGRNNTKGATAQLRRDYQFVLERFGIRPQLLAVSGEGNKLSRREIFPLRDARSFH